MLEDYANVFNERNLYLRFSGLMKAFIESFKGSEIKGNVAKRGTLFNHYYAEFRYHLYCAYYFLRHLDLLENIIIKQYNELKPLIEFQNEVKIEYDSFIVHEYLLRIMPFLNMETAEITVTNPTSTSDWQDFYTYTIQWTSVGFIEDVKIELYKGATFVEEISWLLGYTDNDGEYDFYVSTLEDYEGADYRIKITDNDDATVFDFSDYFSLNVVSDEGDTFPFAIPSYNVSIILAIISIVGIIFIKKIRQRR